MGPTAGTRTQSIFILYEWEAVKRTSKNGAFVFSPFFRCMFHRFGETKELTVFVCLQLLFVLGLFPPWGFAGSEVSLGPGLKDNLAIDVIYVRQSQR